jgi:hypothetical protein
MWLILALLHRSLIAKGDDSMTIRNIFNIKKGLALILAISLLFVTESVMGPEAFASSGGIVIDMSDANPNGSGTGWIYSGGVYTILNGANVIVEGNNSVTKNRLAVNTGANADIILNGVTIDDLDNNQSPILLGVGARANLILSGANSLTGGFNAAGIHSPAGTAITISGDGSLEVNAGNGGADIGTSYYSNNVGDRFVAAEVNGRKEHTVVGNPVISEALTVIIPTGVKVTVPSDSTLTVNGILNINGTLENDGILNILGRLGVIGILNNNGDIYNAGTLDISGVLNNDNMLMNSGSITIKSIGALKGSGEMAGNKLTGADVSSSTLSGTPTQTTITVNAASLMTATGQDIEYVVSTAHIAPPDEWQDETTFIGLTAGFTYYIFARSKENNHYGAGMPSVSAPINTIKFPGADVNVPTVKGAPTRTTIIVNAVNLMYPTDQMIEYAIGETVAAPSSEWQPSTIFNGLIENTDYYVFARAIENDLYYTGVPSVSEPIKTAKYTPPVKPPKTKISNVATGKKLAKLTFKKVNKSLKVTSYQIQYRVKGTKKWKSTTVKTKYTGSTTARATIKKLEAGKKYQFRIRAYKSSIGTVTPANWSPVKTSSKIKK